MDDQDAAQDRPWDQKDQRHCAAQPKISWPIAEECEACKCGFGKDCDANKCDATWVVSPGRRILSCVGKVFLWVEAELHDTENKKRCQAEDTEDHGCAESLGHLGLTPELSRTTKWFRLE